MDVRRDARRASTSEGATAMPLKVTLRRCIGSKRFEIEPHDAPVEDFPKQPSQKDGLGRMCKTHWNAYTAGLARDAKARKAAEPPTAPADEPAAVDASPAPTRKRSTNTVPASEEAAAGE
jgi:hypothetical protein